MSERIAETYEREEFSAAVKRAALARANGHCERCGAPLRKGKYRYNHKVPTRRGGPPTLDNCEVLCHDGPGTCDYDQTYGIDLPGIAAVKRYGKNRLPTDIDRPVRKPGNIPTRPMPKSSRPIANRPFPKRAKK